MSNEVAVAEQNQVEAVAVKKNPIAVMLESAKQQFMDVNAGMDLDFVRMGEHIKINKKGTFELRSDDTVKFGDTIDVVIALGEQRHTLWGKKDTPENGELICMEKTYEEAVAQLQEFLSLRPEAAERYSVGDIQLRYLAYLVPVEALGGDEIPDVYLLSLAQSDTYGFAAYAKGLFRGDKNKGIPKNSGVNSVITRLTTEERDVKGSTDTYLGVKFEAVGPFKPEDYGIKA